MPQIYDMGPTALLPLRRKACCGFFRPKNQTTSAVFKPANLGTKGQHTIYKKITRHTTATTHWLTFCLRIMLHISNHHGDKYRKLLDRKKEQLEDTCQKHRTHSCRVMNEQDRRAGSRPKQLT